MRRAVLASAILIAGCGGAAAAPIGNPDPLAHVTPAELYERGLALGRAGDFVRAEQYLAASLERGHPEDQVVPVLVAACVQSSRLSSALSYAEPYLARHPTNWSLRLLIATIRIGLGTPDVARDELDRVLRDAPEEPPQAHYFLGVLYRDHLSNLDTAREHFRRYIALAPDGEHAEEARASLTPEEGGRPERVMPARVEPAGSEEPGSQEPSPSERVARPAGAQGSESRP
ncbi:MAG: tetratricopeptide repeat protein [Sandaracinaceae bacterium]|nr:tetratricopeptide repeat protein [Sandaracinaceae bacterium]